MYTLDLKSVTSSFKVQTVQQKAQNNVLGGTIYLSWEAKTTQLRLPWQISNNNHCTCTWKQKAHTT